MKPRNENNFLVEITPEVMDELERASNRLSTITAFTEQGYMLMATFLGERVIHLTTALQHLAAEEQGDSPKPHGKAI